MKRKILTIGAVTIAAAFALTACAGGNEGDGGSVTYTSYGGAAEKAITTAWLEPFSKESGIKVVTDSPTEYAKVKSMVESKQVIWDVVEAGSDLGVRTAGDILTEIDCKVVACESFKGGSFPVEKYGMPVFIYSVVLTYNTHTFTNDTPNNWSDFFDTKKYPGKRAIYGKAATGGLNGILEASLIADGVAIKDLYPLDVERALKKIDTIKDDLIIYNDFSQCITLVATGEAAMGNCYNGRALIAAQQGLPIGISWANQVQFADYLVIPKGSPNTDKAMKLLAYIGSDKLNGKLGEYIAYGPANPNSPIDPEAAKKLPTANQLKGADRPIVLDQIGWWTENGKAMDKRWAEWKAK